MLESKFKQELIAEIEERFPGAIVLKTNANQIQGMADNIILFRNKWAAFDTKQSEHSKYRPNQPYYIKLLNEMSYAVFVHPKNKEDFLCDLQQTFRFSGRARILKP